MNPAICAPDNLIFGGAAILVNLYAGDAAFVLLFVALAALVTTKLPILIGGPIGPFPVKRPPPYGMLIFLHEARIELCMIFGSIAVLLDSQANCPTQSNR